MFFSIISILVFLYLSSWKFQIFKKVTQNFIMLTMSIFSFYSFGEEKILDLGEIEITGEVRRPNVELVLPKKYVDEAVEVVAKNELQQLEKILLLPLRLEEIKVDLETPEDYEKNRRGNTPSLRNDRTQREGMRAYSKGIKTSKQKKNGPQTGGQNLPRGSQTDGKKKTKQ